MSLDHLTSTQGHEYYNRQTKGITDNHFGSRFKFMNTNNILLQKCYTLHWLIFSNSNYK